MTEVDDLRKENAILEAEVERLKAQPTAAQERAAIVKWLRDPTVAKLDNLEFATRIKLGWHWPLPGEKP